MGLNILYRSGGSGGSSGKSFGGDGNREKLTMYIVGGAVVCITAYAVYEMSYKEITWKDFINR